MTYDKISVLFDSNNSWKINQLKIIMHEWLSDTQGCGKCRQTVKSLFDFHDILFAGLNDNCLVAQTKGFVKKK